MDELVRSADDGSGQRGISRRRVVKGAAWAVPIIAVGASAPAYAITGEPPTVLVGVACKLSGASQSRFPAETAQGILAGDFSKAFALPVQVTNNTSKPIVLKPSISITNVRDGGEQCGPALRRTRALQPHEHCADLQRCTCLASAMAGTILD